jgi:hypothetical protein
MPIKFDIDQKALTAALAKFPQETSKALRKAQGAAMSNVVRTARKNHRFTTQSGNLERSISFDVDKSGLVAEGFLNANVAKYGRRIHEGGGGGVDSRGRKMTNHPDPFLYNALDASESKYIAMIDTAIGNAIKAAGL